MSQTYMTAKLNLTDGTIVYPQVSLDNVVNSINDPTLATIATGISISVDGGTATLVTNGGSGVAKFVGANGLVVSMNEGNEVVFTAPTVSTVGSAGYADEAGNAVTAGTAGVANSLVGGYVVSSATNATSAGTAAAIASGAIVGGYKTEIISGNTIGQAKWFNIVNATGTTVTVEPGEAYKVNAANSAVTISATLGTTGQWGQEGHAEIFVAGTGNVHTGANVVLANGLEADSVNNCTLRFHDGKCIISVEDHVAGYIVVSATGTSAGSLYYGLGTASEAYIAVDASLNGQVLDLGGVTTSAGEKHLVGNGYTQTIVSGGIQCSSKTTFANLGMSNVTVSSGTLTLGDVYIPNGGTVAVSGGTIVPEKILLDGTLYPNEGIVVSSGCSVVGSGTVDMSQNRGYNFTTNSGSLLQGLTLTGGKAGELYTGREAYLLGGNVVSCLITGNTEAADAVGFMRTFGTLDKCIVSGNTGNTMGQTVNSLTTFIDCELSEKITFLGSAGKITLVGSNSFAKTVAGIYGGFGTVTISSGAIIDLTGNTNAIPIKPGSGITVNPDVFVINSAGTSVGIDPRTYSAINKDGTTEPADYIYGYAQGLTQQTSNYVPIVLSNNVISRVTELDKSKMSAHERHIAVMDDCANRHVNYYVQPDDLTKKMDGTDSKLDGTDGDVMTEIWPYYRLRVQLAPQNDTETRECVLFSRKPFTFTDSNNVEHVATRPDGFKISPTGDVYRQQYIGYYMGTTITDNGTKKLRSISSSASKKVYPDVNLKLGPVGSDGDSVDSFLNRAIANGMTCCNELHYEILFDLYVCDKLTVNTQSTSVGYSNMSGNSWSTIYPRPNGYTNQVAFYGGQTLAGDADADIAPLWASCTITANSLTWATAPEHCQYTTDATTGVHTVTAYGWKNGANYIYTKGSDGMPSVGTVCYSDNACTTATGYSVSAVNTGTAAASRVTSCKYFIENPWGSLWQNLAGFLPICTGDNIGYFRTTSINRYKELLKIPISEAGTSRAASGGNAAIDWVEFAWPSASNWVTTWNLDTFLPTSVGTNVMQNYFYTSMAASPRAGFRGGPAYYGSYVGLGYVSVSSAVGGASVSIGVRPAA